MGSIGEAVRALPGRVAALADPDGSPERFRALLEDHVLTPLLAATADGGPVPQQELTDLCDALELHVPSEVEALLEPRGRILLTLLRRGAIGPAWTLAEDFASGRVQQQVSFSTSSGASRTSVPLPLPTVVEGDRVFAWLPGFRDPRWQIDDDVYDISGEIVARAGLESAMPERDVFVLAGWVQLSVLDTRPDDPVAVLVSGADGTVARVPARRLRRPDLVKGAGPELTRLAWAGWRCELPLCAVADGAATLRIEAGRDGLRRVARLDARRAELVHTAAVEHAGRSFRLHARGGELQLAVRTLPPRTRLVPRPLRRLGRTLLTARGNSHGAR